MLQGLLSLVHLMTFGAFDCIDKCAGARMSIAEILLALLTPIGVVDRDLVSTGNTLNLFCHLTPLCLMQCYKSSPESVRGDRANVDLERIRCQIAGILRRLAESLIGKLDTNAPCLLLRSSRQIVGSGQGRRFLASSSSASNSDAFRSPGGVAPRVVRRRSA